MGTFLLLALLLVGLQNPGTVSSQQNANYVVGAQDVLTVTVFNEPQLSGRFRVENDGQFNYPFLGRLQAAGTTLAEIAALVKTRLADGYLRDPQVTVDVEQFRSQNVFVMGEVRTPGRYTLTGSVTLVEALAQAGSIAPTAGNEVLILRPRKTTSESPTLPDSGDADVQRVNLRDIQAGKLAANVTIRDGDTIFVPKAQRFFVTGHVRTPRRLRARAEPDRPAGDLDGRRGHRSRQHPAPAHHPQQEGNRRQAGGHRAGRRHDRRAAAHAVRVLFLNPTAEMGGAENALLEVIAGLRDARPSWSIGLIAGADGPLLERARELGADVRVLPFPPALSRLGEEKLGGGWRARAAVGLRGLQACVRSASTSRNCAPPCESSHRTSSTPTA